MGLTRSFRETVLKRVQDDPAFRIALIEEAAQNLIDGDPKTALGQLRDVVNATIGFDALANKTGIPKTSLMRMLGEHGNPRSDNLGTILEAIRQNLGIKISVHVEPAPQLEHA